MKIYGMIMICLLTSSSILGQKQDGSFIELNYIQKPLEKLDVNWKYTVKITQGNTVEISEKRDAFQAKLDKAESDYQAELSTYNELPSAERVITKKPQRRVIKPYFIGKKLDTDFVAEQIDLIGFDKGGQQFTAEVILKGFQFITSESKSSDDGWAYYLLTYRNPVALKVTDEGGTVLFQRDLENEKYTQKVSKSKTKAESDNSFRENKVSLIESLESESYDKQIQRANKRLNYFLGYPEISKKIKVYTAKGKKLEYPELDKALNLCKRGFLTYANSDQAKGQIDEALEIWESQLTQKDIDDKKAKINKVVASAIYINCVYGYSVTGEIEKAEAALTELKLLKPARFLSTINEVEKFYNDFKARQ